MTTSEHEELTTRLSRTLSDVSEVCKYCRRIESRLHILDSVGHLFVLHMEIPCSHRKHDRERKKANFQKRNQLHKLVSALRNTNGGSVIIHLEGHEPEDRYLEYFDEFAAKIFPHISDDGELSTTTYNRVWLCDLKGFEDFRTVIKIDVTPSNCVSTVEFNTKIRNDFENTEPSHLCLQVILAKDRTGNSQPHIRGINQNMQNFHEHRHIEIKSFSPRPGVREKMLSDIDCMIHYIWYDLKLRDNITSMSKLTDGGSIYIGISETSVQLPFYRTRKIELTGIETEFHHSVLSQKLYEFSMTHLVVLRPDGMFSEPPMDLLAIELHPLSTADDRYVLEVAVKYFNGIVFYDRNGPRAYLIQHDTTARMDRDEWYRRLKNWKIEQISDT